LPPIAAPPAPQKKLLVLPGVDHNDEAMLDAKPVVAFLRTLEED
jgi:hypothetical protein